MAELLLEFVVAFLIVVGGIFALVGSIGMVKLPELMTRLHAPTKATTLGVGGVLVASMIHFLVFFDEPTVHELIITLFLFLTAPVTANFLAKTYLHQRGAGARELPTATGSETGWATFDPASDGPPRR